MLRASLKRAERLNVRVPQTLAIQVGIKEAIVPTGTASGATDRDFDLKKLRDVLDRCGIVITERRPSKFVLFSPMPTYSVSSGEFMAKTIEEDLTRLVAPPETGAGVVDGSTVICTQSLLLLLLY